MPISAYMIAATSSCFYVFMVWTLLLDNPKFIKIIPWVGHIKEFYSIHAAFVFTLTVVVVFMTQMVILSIFADIMKESGLSDTGQAAKGNHE